MALLNPFHNSRACTLALTSLCSKKLSVCYSTSWDPTLGVMKIRPNGIREVAEGQPRSSISWWGWTRLKSHGNSDTRTHPLSTHYRIFQTHAEKISLLTSLSLPTPVCATHSSSSSLLISHFFYQLKIKLFFETLIDGLWKIFWWLPIVLCALLTKIHLCKAPCLRKELFSPNTAETRTLENTLLTVE